MPTQFVMADRLPNETIELVLSLAYDPFGAEDVDAERERQRRTLLRLASLVCRRWRPVATTMLPLSLVIRSADELEPHAAAQIGWSLSVERTVCVTVSSCFAEAVDFERDLHAMVAAMAQIQFLRLDCAGGLDGQRRTWPGRHMIVDSIRCDRCLYSAVGKLFNLLEASPGFRHLSMLTSPDVDSGGCPALGPNFSARIETLRCGSDHDGLYFQYGRLLEPRNPSSLARLWSIRCVDVSLYDLASAFVDPALDDRLPALRSVTIGLGGGDFGGAGLEGAIRLLGRLPKSCPLLICEVFDAELAARDAISRCVRMMTSALGEVAAVTIAKLIVDVGDYEVEESWRSSDDAQALGRACEARGVAFEIKI